ncbi:MAG: tetratricopeptide repeat protein, partial [Methylococcaceae bacterium]|nr:tetratricopeptide repeat protein [Methylococcaceae bacterium]
MSSLSSNSNFPIFASLSEDEQEQFQELSRHIEWAQSFSLIILFVENHALADNFKQLLQSQMQGRVSALQVLEPENAATLTLDIFTALAQQIIPNVVVPLWLELHHHSDKLWQQANDNFLARLNENRDKLRREFPRPFIMLLPLATKSRFREIAPDLWSVRSFTEELLYPASDAVNTPITQTRFYNYLCQQATPTEFEEVTIKTAALTEWQRVLPLQLQASEMFLVVWRAYDSAYETGQRQLALQLSKQLLALACQVVEQQAQGSNSLRNLSVALNKSGDIEMALGNHEQAYEAYQQSLTIRQALQNSLGDTPEVLRDLSISLNKVGQVEEKQGRYQAALSVYQQALTICQQLQNSLGDTPEVLRDLSVSLNKVGQVEKKQGRYQAALSFFQQGLTIAQQLQNSLSD